MRTIQEAKESKQAWERESRSLYRHDNNAEVQDFHHKRNEWTKTSSSSMHQTMATTLNRTFRPLRKQTRSTPDLIVRPQQVVLETTRGGRAKGDNFRTLIKSNSLPPIHDSRFTSESAQNLCTPIRPVERDALHMGKKVNLSSLSPRKDRALIWRQRQMGQLTNTVELICSSLAAFNMAEHNRDEETVWKDEKEKALGNTSVSVPRHLLHDHSSWHLEVGENNPSTHDSGVIMEGIKDSGSVCETKCHQQPLSDSAIETETLSSHKNGGMGEGEQSGNIEGESYYTIQKITEWIIRVNASLFSTNNDELNKEQKMEEEDVDTIKIIYSH